MNKQEAGRKGAEARNKKLSPEQRSASAKNAANARHGKSSKS